MSARSIEAAPSAIVGVDIKASQRIMLRMIIAIVVLLLLVLANLDFVGGLYFRNQLTSTGYLVNGAILVLFFAGMVKIVLLLNHYSREEAALGVFMANLQTHHSELIDGVAKESLIHQRYDSLRLMRAQRAPINQSALAAATVATESTRASMPRFINNILILTGVFGTIVALSIALLGASDLLDASQSGDGMGMVIHGMSTALSTTITAIVSYLLFGYFYLKLSDVQTNLLSTLEEVTTLHLLPRFESRPDTVVNDVADLVGALRDVAASMQRAQRDQAALEQQIGELVESQSYYLANISNRLSHIRGLLRDGFRLPEDSDSK